MSQRELGRATYKAHRLMGVVSLTATGELANFNDKPDFDQLPFLIFPPIWAFYVIKPDIGLPAIRPFTYTEQIAFPQSAKSIRIQDAIGYHDVPIAELTIPDFNVSETGTVAGANFCVFRMVGPGSTGGINPLLMAQCDTILPAIYARVFGPATADACRKYINDNGGLAASGETMQIVQEMFKAWIDMQPPGPHKLIVVGNIDVPTSGWSATLRRAEPQGSNPNIIILELDLIKPTGNVLQVVSKVTARFEESPPAHPYTEATIRQNGLQLFTIQVTRTS